MSEQPAYLHHGWPSVLDSFRQLAEANPNFEPMAHFVERLAASRSAGALYPLQPMHTLVLSLHERVHAYQDRVSVTYEEGEFVVRYQGGPMAPVWTKRSPEGIAALERFFGQMRWFTEWPATSIASGG